MDEMVIIIAAPVESERTQACRRQLREAVANNCGYKTYDRLMEALERSFYEL